MTDSTSCKIKISGALSYEGETTLLIAHQILGLLIGEAGTPPASRASSHIPPPLSGSTTAKAFVGSKRPATDVEKIACVAFYLTHHERTSKFKSNDLQRVATDAALDISNFPRAVDNATRQSKFLAKAGDGAKQITSLGEEIVKALPSREAVAAALKSLPSRRRRANRKAKS